jgi:hypothetical protein
VRIFERLVRWLIFSVVLAIVPLVFAAFRLSSRAQLSLLADSVSEILARGDLLLVAAILAARASGEIIGSSSSYRLLKIVANGSAILILLFGALYFADVTAVQMAGEVINDAMVCTTSTYVFFSSVVCGASCIALAEL